MEVIDYQIEMLDVGAADAFILWFKTSDKNNHLVLIDAGNYGDGDKIVEYLHHYYPGYFVNLAIVTHCDIDHYGGFVRMLEKIQNKDDDAVQICQFWVNDPANHDIDVDDVKRVRTQQTVEERLKSVYTLSNGLNLLDLIDGLPNVYRKECFAGFRWCSFREPKLSPALDSFYSCFTILGPTKTYYESLILDMRNNLESVDESVQDAASSLKNVSFDDIDDDNSAHNRSSTIFLFEACGKKCLFAGDAARESFYKMYGEHLSLIKNVDWLKVPHHGSDHNLDSQLVAYINPKTAYISTKELKKDRSPNVVDALKSSGSKVYSTHVHGNLLHNGNRTGWVPVLPL